MFFHVPDQSSQPPPSMVSRALVVNVAENALDRIGLRAIAWQPNQFKTGMLFQPALNRFRLMNAVIVANDIKLAIAFPEGLLKLIQPLAEEGVVFVRPQDVISLPRRLIERRRQIALLILARGPDFKLRAFEHPLGADLGEQIDVEFIGEENQLGWPLVFDPQTNPRQSPGALWVVIPAFELGALPDVAGGFQLESNGLVRDFNLCQHGESQGQGGASVRELDTSRKPRAEG